ncbi:hypothetical protein L218DRAFT_992930 [Marasmius fiardii PR-910]|nr:hypothetical protein L218DRAFT_992930 [Marasmius fiardii PR-910]
MPASTSAFEYLFEIVNDTTTLLYVMNGGVTTRVDAGERISLVLSSGSTYHYIVKQEQQVTKITVKSWRDAQCKASMILGGSLEKTLPGASIICSRVA